LHFQTQKLAKNKSIPEHMMFCSSTSKRTTPVLHIAL
jgi:hypothetical protein